jgi:hypothetical protein
MIPHEWLFDGVLVSWSVCVEVSVTSSERRKGRPHLRWMDDDVADLRVMKIRQWTETAEDREQWRLVVKEAKAYPEL